MKGSTPFLNSRTCSPFFDASMAHQITTASRASSDGWKLTGPMSTQRRAPLSDGAMARVNGSSGMSSRHDRDEQQRPGQAAPAVVVLPGGPEQEDAAQDRAAQLPRRRSRARRSGPSR